MLFPDRPVHRLVTVTPVNLGDLRVHQGEPIVGVIVSLLLHLRCHAIQSGGAYCDDKRIHTGQTADFGRVIVSVGDYATGEGTAGKNRRRFAGGEALVGNTERVRMFGVVSPALAKN